MEAFLDLMLKISLTSLVVAFAIMALVAAVWFTVRMFTEIYDILEDYFG